jgi:hypothetical protein
LAAIIIAAKEFPFHTHPLASYPDLDTLWSLLDWAPEHRGHRLAPQTPLRLEGLAVQARVLCANLLSDLQLVTNKKPARKRSLFCSMPLPKRVKNPRTRDDRLFVGTNVQLPTMKTRDLLRHLDFGSPVAEFDSNLENYFVDTEALHKLLSGERDVYAGDKGTGKTALFKIFRRRLSDMEDKKKIEVVQAFNVTGNPVFQRLAALEPLAESQYRAV